jgi:hypothetical protein
MLIKMGFKMFLSLRVHRRPQKYGFRLIKRANPSAGFTLMSFD